MVSATTEDKLKNRNLIIAIAVYLIFLIAFSIWGLVEGVWAEEIEEKLGFVKYSLFGQTYPIHKEIQLVILATLGGAHGGLLRGLSELAHHAGARTFLPSWVPWYFARPFLGAGIGVAVYYALRAGFLTGINAGDIDVYAAAAIGILAGIFERDILANLRRAMQTIAPPQEEGMNSQPTSSSASSRSASKDASDPISILKIRLVKSEITKEQYEELKKTLES